MGSPQARAESVARVLAREQRRRGTPAAPRLPLLHLLTRAAATTLPPVAARARLDRPVGTPARLPEEAWAALMSEGAAGRIGGPADARRDREARGITVATGEGGCRLGAPVERDCLPLWRAPCGRDGSQRGGGWGGTDQAVSAARPWAGRKGSCRCRDRRMP